MLAITQYRVKIRVDKEPGVYSFEPISGTGKTRLCELCKRYHNFGVNVDGYDFYDFREGRELPRGLDLLVVDRYGLYPALDDELREIGRETIVLVDDKESCFEEACQIEVSEEGHVRVY